MRCASLLSAGGIVVLIVAGCSRSEPPTVVASAGSVGDKAVSLVRVSGATPFPVTCATRGGFQWNSEVEPHIAVNPLNRHNIVIAWRQDQYELTDGARGIVAAASFDGGRTWRATVVPGVALCTGGDFERASHPWLSFGADGAVYLSSNAYTEDVRSVVVINRSVDGGASWSAPVRPSSIDERLVAEGRAVVAGHLSDASRAYLALPQDVGGAGTAFFSRTTDGGASWPTPMPIQSASPVAMADNDLVALPDGAVLDVIAGNFGTRHFRAIRSDDDGLTWGSAVLIGESPGVGPVLDPGGPSADPAFVDVYPLQKAAASPEGGVFVVWPELVGPFVPNSVGALSFVRSDDGGRIWTPPRAIEVDAVHPFLPTLAVARDGTLGLAFYDLRNDSPDGFRADVWFAWSRDRGESWNLIYVAGPVDLLGAPTHGGGGAFLGEYIGIVALDGAFGVAFVMPMPQAAVGLSDIFFARIEVPQ